jgi:NADH-quinone oxidoreductase subunit N
MNMGAFAVAIAVINESGSEQLSALDGLGRRGRQGAIAALAMALFMFSLIGLPPTVGFIGKFYLFSAVIQAKLYWLAVVGVLNSVVSLYYYARIIKHMYFNEPSNTQPFRPGFSYSSLLVGLAAATLFFGLFWNALSIFTENSAHLLT